MLHCVDYASFVYAGKDDVDMPGVEDLRLPLRQLKQARLSSRTLHDERTLFREDAFDASSVPPVVDPRDVENVPVRETTVSAADCVGMSLASTVLHSWIMLLGNIADCDEYEILEGTEAAAEQERCFFANGQTPDMLVGDGPAFVPYKCVVQAVTSSCSVWTRWLVGRRLREILVTVDDYRTRKACVQLLCLTMARQCGSGSVRYIVQAFEKWTGFDRVHRMCTGGCSMDQAYFARKLSALTVEKYWLEVVNEIAKFMGVFWSFTSEPQECPLHVDLRCRGGEEKDEEGCDECDLADM